LSFYKFSAKKGSLVPTLAEQWEERGFRRAIQNAIQDGLEAKFGAEGLAIMPRIREIKDADRLRELLKLAWTASSLKEFQGQIQES
jgi:hypothetical protein